MLKAQLILIAVRLIMGAIALGLGFGVGSSTAVQGFMPQWMKYIFGGSGIVPAAVIAILLNILLPKDKNTEPFQVE